MSWEFLVNLASNYFKFLSLGHKCDETAFECLLCGMSSLIVFVCFQDRLLWSACLLWSLAMSIVRFIWKLSATTTLPHIWCSPDLTYRHSGSFRRSMSYAMHAAWQSDISYLGRGPLSWGESRMKISMVTCLMLSQNFFFNFSLVFLFCDNRLVTAII